MTDRYLQQMEDLFPVPPIKRHGMRANSYPALMAVSFVILLIGMATIVAGFYFAIDFYDTGRYDENICFMIAAAGTIIGIHQIAISELVRVMVAIEANTNYTARSLDILREELSEDEP